MKDFEELEGVEDNTDDTNVVDEDEDDEEFRPAQASSLNSADIFYEMEKRGLKSTGFPDTDIEMLQQAFNDEFQNDMEDLKAKRMESKRRAAQQAGMQRRRLMMQQSLHEEEEELASNRNVSLIVDRVKEDNTTPSIRIELNSVAARSLAKSMWINTTITHLNLSSNQLNDHCGKYLARILNRNNVLNSLELDGNNFGPMTCKAFGESLKLNESLKYLSLDSNPLMTPRADPTEFKEFCSALAVNKNLTSINLFRCGITAEAGKSLVNALEQNPDILFLDIGHNSITMFDQKRFSNAMDSNLKNYEMKMRQKEIDDAKQAEIDTANFNKAEDERKAKELAEWLDKRRAERAEGRRDEHDAELERKKQEAIEAAEFAKKEAARKAAAEAEAEAKKAKKGGKKKKK